MAIRFNSKKRTLSSSFYFCLNLGVVMSDQEYREKLVEDNIRLAYLVLKQYKLDSEEYFDVAAIGLWKAANTYDVTKGVAFSTYAMTVMRNELKRLYKILTRQNQIAEYAICSYDAEINDNTDEAIINYKLASNVSVEDDVVLKLTIQRLKDKLSAREQVIFDLVLLGYNQPEIARYLNISQSYVSRIIKKIKVKVKSCIES